jgi:hypothetical protein
VVLVLLLVAVPAHAQDRQRGFRLLPGAKADDFAVNNVAYNGRLTFVRLRYTPSQTGYGGGGGYFGGINYQWDHDYPRGDNVAMTLLDEITTLRTHPEGTNIFAVTDDELFKYPIAYLVEPGFWTQTPEEAERLRNYLLKGGFLIVDEFAGRGPLWNLQERIAEVLPGAALVQLDASAEIFHSFFEIDSLNYQHPYYGGESLFFGVYEDNDPRKRLMVIVNFNNDIGEYWEWSGTGFIPIPLTNEGFKLGVNYFIYALTH